MTMTTPRISAKERDVLRALGARVAEIGSSPAMAEKRRLWKKLNALESERPMLLTETGGVWEELFPPSAFVCESDMARGMERHLRDLIFYVEQIGDDRIIEPRITYNTVVHAGGYGVEVKQTRGDDGHGHGSYVWEAPLKRLPEDLDKLHFRTFRIDAEATAEKRAFLEEIFSGVLPVVERGGYWWTQGMTWSVINLLGLEAFMLIMYDQPECLHALMTFLRDDHQQALDWYEQAGVLTLNNEDDYIGSGGCGYTDLLPAPDFVPGRPARIKDLWGLSESQETVSVSPEMFAEFVFPYQAPIISRFGFACYGCCEPVDQRWHILKTLPNLRRVSISPWSNVEQMAANLGTNYVFSRKPNPAFVSTSWEEDVIRRDLRETMEATRGLNVEFVLKDVHTLANDPSRLGRWTQIAREVMDEVGV